MRACLTVILLLSFCMVTKGQESVFLYGANGRPVNSADRALVQKEVKKISDTRYRVRVSVLSDKEWNETRTERIRIRGNRLRIRYWEGNLLPRSYEIQTRKIEGDLYYFEEINSGVLVRTGHTSSLVPLHLEGRVVDYYPNGNIKSESLYSGNMLVSNKNYYPDGAEYIHDIFYTTDRPPLYSLGNDFFRRFINARIALNELPLHEIHDLVVIGAVIMETGELTGVHVLEGFSPSVNEVLRQTVEQLPGKWEPARLNGEPVRAFVRFPFNFKVNDRSVHHMEMTSDGQFFMLQ
jgi:hypothetical protein